MTRHQELNATGTSAKNREVIRPIHAEGRVQDRTPPATTRSDPPTRRPTRRPPPPTPHRPRRNSADPRTEDLHLTDGSARERSCARQSARTGSDRHPKRRFSPKTAHQTALNRVRMWYSTWYRSKARRQPAFFSTVYRPPRRSGDQPCAIKSLSLQHDANPAVAGDQPGRLVALVSTPKHPALAGITRSRSSIPTADPEPSHRRYPAKPGIDPTPRSTRQLPTAAGSPGRHHRAAGGTLHLSTSSGADSLERRSTTGAEGGLE